MSCDFSPAMLDIFDAYGYPEGEDESPAVTVDFKDWRTQPRDAEGRFTEISSPDRAWHSSPRSNRDSILEHGLLAKITPGQRGEKPFVYLTLDPSDDFAVEEDDIWEVDMSGLDTDWIFPGEWLSVGQNIEPSRLKLFSDPSRGKADRWRTQPRDPEDGRFVDEAVGALRDFAKLDDDAATREHGTLVDNTGKWDGSVEEASVGAYVSMGYYKSVQAALRAGDLSDPIVADIAANMDQVMAGTEITQPLAVYRGFSNGLGLSEGATFGDGAFASFSITKRNANLFAGGGKNRGGIMRLELQPGDHVAFGSSYSAEVILPRGTQFRVKNYDTKNKVWVVEVVDSPPLPAPKDPTFMPELTMDERTVQARHSMRGFYKLVAKWHPDTKERKRAEEQSAQEELRYVEDGSDEKLADAYASYAAKLADAGLEMS